MKCGMCLCVQTTARWPLWGVTGRCVPAAGGGVQGLLGKGAAKAGMVSNSALPTYTSTCHAAPRAVPCRMHCKGEPEAPAEHMCPGAVAAAGVPVGCCLRGCHPEVQGPRLTGQCGESTRTAQHPGQQLSQANCAAAALFWAPCLHPPTSVGP